VRTGGRLCERLCCQQRLRGVEMAISDVVPSTKCWASASPGGENGSGSLLQQRRQLPCETPTM